MLIKIPLKLESEANSREHWHKSASRHTMQKTVTKLYLKTSDIPKLPIHVTLTRFAPRRFDKDENLPMAFKYIKDEIADYVIGYKYSKTGRKLHGRTDDDERITWEYKQEKTKNKEHYFTIEISSTEI